ELKRLFEHATTFGSLIQVPEGLAQKLPALKQLSEATSQDLFVSEALKRLGPLVQQAELLAAQYDAAVANPPYMGGSGMNALVKKFTKDQFPDAKNDLFACFIERGYAFARDVGFNAMVTMHSWMFLSSFEAMRMRVLRSKTIATMAHLGPRAFGSISGEVVQTTAFVVKNCPLSGYRPVFFRLLAGDEAQKRHSLVSGDNRFCTTDQNELQKVPGGRIAYWVSSEFISLFSVTDSVGRRAVKGLDTGGDIDRFLRRWYEPSAAKVSCLSPGGDYWFPLAKGGTFRRWYGNNEFVINYEGQGRDLKSNKANLRSQDRYFEPGLTWTVISVSGFAVRFMPPGFLFDQAGSAIHKEERDEFELEELLASLNSTVTSAVSKMLSPTISFTTGDIREFPIQRQSRAGAVGRKLIETCKHDWDAYESSWDFQSLPLLTTSSEPTPTLESSYTAWIDSNRDTIAEMKRLEEENNRLFIDAYGLADELTPDVPIEQITLTVNPAYRYGGKLTEEEQWTRFRQDTMEELVSYAIGCMMGRYSLDAPGLILADTRSTQPEHISAYVEKVGKPMEDLKFQPDGDGILPVLDDEWFEDDVTVRVAEFLKVVWGSESLTENLRFLEDGLGKPLRKYLLTDFWKSHLQSYKKRPIYWLVQSPKKGFQVLIYLQRYTKDSFNMVLNDYLREYLRKLRNREETLRVQLRSMESGTASVQKELQNTENRIHELEEWEREVIHPLAQHQIEIDLDDGVKVNYPKFYPALAKIAGL
ncbi:MAG: BREX-1 system adenine-specific DNA-methyltransferase PglX, partial [Bacteroidetes Order II. Incertae sedis bacterium]|nr:BREX-1 system adenine-specific DNA-methyltransferase PglX [Bacteroidetes Order II. bacterium]